MPQAVIRVENLSKRYRIGLHEQRHDSLGGVFFDFIRRPMRNLRELKKLTVFKSEEEIDIIWALKDVSFEVNEGDIFGIIGRNGAGKTTCLKILSRITKPTTGRIEINGRVGSLLEVGTGFHPELTGRENIYLNGAILGMNRREITQKFDEIVAFAEVEKFLDTPVKRYSSGMYVRLAFAVAAHLDPKILLVDEVLAVGDMDFQRKCLGKMEKISSEQRTILFVSHNIGVVRKLCTRGIYLEFGKIKKIGNIDDICNEYIRDTKVRKKAQSDNDIVMNVFVKDNQGKILKDWKYKQKILIEVEVQSADELISPAVDLAFYSNDGVKVTAVQSDRLMNLKNEKLRNFKICFNIRNIGITAGQLYLDVGLRCGGDTVYKALEQSVEIIPVSPAMLPPYYRDDTICCLPVDCYIGK